MQAVDAKRGRRQPRAMTCLPRAWWWMGFGLLAGAAARGVAQDVTVSAISAIHPADAPDVLPTLSRGLRPSFPSALKKTTDIGWAAVDFFVDDKGKVLTWAVQATQPAFAEAVEEASASRGKIKPARRGDVAVNARVRMAVLFNPASASVEGRDATPRLLDAAPLVVPRLASGPKDPPVPPQVIWGTVQLDEQGRVTAVKEVPSEFEALLQPALQTWRFAPARQGGVAVAADVRVPFVLVAPERESSQVQVPPKWIKRAHPVYPETMRRSGLRGNVVVEFMVDIEGRVRNAVVVRTLNPAFDEPALTAVRAWKFEPGRRDGVPVNTRMQQSISFSMDTLGGGDDGVEVRRRASQAKLPEELRYDVAPQIKSLVRPIYPYALLRKGAKGKAQVSMLIAADGKVAETKVFEAAHPELGYALQAAVELFEYSPAVKAAAPTQALVSFEQDFTIWGDTLVSPTDRALLQLEEKHPEKLLKSGDLDQMVKPTHARPPLYPRSLRRNPVDGQAVIEFLINEQGAVHLPRVISSSQPEFGYAAAQAVSAWRFSPPLSKGKPGVTRVRVPVQFNAAESEDPAPQP